MSRGLTPVSMKTNYRFKKQKDKASQLNATPLFPVGPHGLEPWTP